MVDGTHNIADTLQSAERLKTMFKNPKSKYAVVRKRHDEILVGAFNFLERNKL